MNVVSLLGNGGGLHEDSRGVVCGVDVGVPLGVVGGVDVGELFGEL